MRRCGAWVAEITLLAFAFLSGSAAKAQERTGVNENRGADKPLSDREKAGLRGPVRSVQEDRTYPAWTDANGNLSPEVKSWNKTEYDREGRVIATWGRNSHEHGMEPTMWLRRSVYNAAGQPLRRTVESDGKVQSEVVYQYDDKGRIKSITDSNAPDNPIAFRDDADGRKTKIAIRKPIDLPEGTGAVSSSVESLFDTDGSSMVSWYGGSTVTTYDKSDRPIEVEMHDVNGVLMSRAVRVYGDHGQVIEEKMLMDDPLAMIPAAQRRKLLEAGVTAQQLREQFAQFLAGSEVWSSKYAYDAQGRKIATTHNIFNHIKESTSTSYNEHGDVAEEVTHQEASGAGSAEEDVTRDSETVYSYEYDLNGNWTLRKTSSRELPDGTLKNLGNQVQRTIEYY